tara:strand:- start:311 stop:496 length:186 start_codon:yes stop_codon:yes gene_type:complete
MIKEFLISVVDLKISILQTIRKHLTGEAKLDEDYKRWTSGEDLKKWVKENESNKRNKSTER